MTPIISKEWMMEALISMNSVKKENHRTGCSCMLLLSECQHLCRWAFIKKKDVTNVTITNPIYNKSITITCNVDLSFYIIRYQSMLITDQLTSVVNKFHVSWLTVFSTKSCGFLSMSFHLYVILRFLIHWVLNYN